MLRLLLPTEKKMLRLEYAKRMLTLASLMVAFVLAAWGVAQLPGYVLLTAEARVLHESLRVATDPVLNKDREALKEELRMVSKQLRLIDVPAYQVSQVLAHVTEAQTRAIGLSSIAFDTISGETEEEGTTGMLVLTGVAQTRVALLQFRDALRANKELISDVDLPLASLAKDIDVPFVITITLTPLTAL
ncbi:MAG: hypothetical protein RL150_640 [Candidatus Parcubacteria bacterium]|jgi:hypothetical protein